MPLVFLISNSFLQAVVSYSQLRCCSNDYFSLLKQTVWNSNHFFVYFALFISDSNERFLSFSLSRLCVEFIRVRYSLCAAGINAAVLWLFIYSIQRAESKLFTFYHNCLKLSDRLFYLINHMFVYPPRYSATPPPCRSTPSHSNPSRENSVQP